MAKQNVSRSRKPSSSSSSSRTHQAEPSTSSAPIESFELVCRRICQVILPVFLCSIYVCLLIRLLELNVPLESNELTLIAKAWLRFGLLPAPPSPMGAFNIANKGQQQQGFDDAGSSVVSNLIIVLSLIALLIILTLIVLFIFYMEWHKCLYYYYYIPSLIILLFLSPIFIRELSLSLNCFSIDYLALVLFVYNFTILGMISIFQIIKSPLILQQFYLIHNAALLAVLVVFTLPIWASWLLLGFLVLWDLFAVLAPIGPLNLIIRMAEKEGVVEMPGLIYKTDEQKPEVSGESERRGRRRRGRSRRGSRRHRTPESNDREHISTVKSDDESEGSKRKADDYEESGSTSWSDEELSQKSMMSRGMEERGVNIGLGDFIFYGLLIGLTCKGSKVIDFQTVLASFLSIIIGLIITLIILATTKRALPALPMSIALGLLISGLSIHFVPPLSNKLSAGQVFV